TALKIFAAENKSLFGREKSFFSCDKLLKYGMSRGLLFYSRFSCHSANSQKSSKVFITRVSPFR
ncbi:MAG: hypothetical protein ACT4O9_03020, partial [Blastocatellia bacterium]